MASSLDYAEYVMDQLSGVGILRAKKMFGEYMIAAVLYKSTNKH